MTKNKECGDNNEKDKGDTRMLFSTENILYSLFIYTLEIGTFISFLLVKIIVTPIWETVKSSHGPVRETQFGRDIMQISRKYSTSYPKWYKQK